MQVLPLACKFYVSKRNPKNVPTEEGNNTFTRGNLSITSQMHKRENLMISWPRFVGMFRQAPILWKLVWEINKVN